MLFKLKPPPSGRFWYCYELDPIVNFKIEPLLSSRTLNFNFITNSIEKKFKEAIKESLVYPFWDDIVFSIVQINCIVLEFGKNQN